MAFVKYVIAKLVCISFTHVSLKGNSLQQRIWCKWQGPKQIANHSDVVKVVNCFPAELFKFVLYQNCSNLDHNLNGDLFMELCH